jgi:DNA-binding response OmpR family regulator
MSKPASEMNILIIDEDEKFCNLICESLERSFAFHSIVTAPNIFYADKKIVNQFFDLIIVDQGTPDQSGIEFIERIKANSKFSKTKVILISADLHQEDVIQVMRLGTKKIMVKPFTGKQITDLVAEVLKITAGIKDPAA